jgi:hypothetical protein
MLHRNRVWSVAPVATADDLAEKLTEHTWTCCQAFELQGYIFASDATCGDGAQEYAVLRRVVEPGEFVQVESITFSWCSLEKALALIKRITTGEFDASTYGQVSARRFQTPAEHGRCHLCQ